MISTKNLTLKSSGGNGLHILKNISVSLPKGSITTFIGKSGAGKTSLLKCLAQLYKHYQGDILYQVREVQEGPVLRSHPGEVGTACSKIPYHYKSLKNLTCNQRVHAVGFVFQQFNLFPHMTVMQNCVQPQLTALGVTLEQAQQKANSWLDALGLSVFKDVYPNQLSGGQQQRVAIARALVLEPQVLLFDEPSSALDPQGTKLLAALLRDLNKQGITIGLCSHDVSFIKELLDKVYLLEDGAIISEYQLTDGALSATGSIGQFLGEI